MNMPIAMCLLAALEKNAAVIPLPKMPKSSFLYNIMPRSVRKDIVGEERLRRHMGFRQNVADYTTAVAGKKTADRKKFIHGAVNNAKMLVGTAVGAPILGAGAIGYGVLKTDSPLDMDRMVQ